ncbi:MAG: phosphoethanolamine transferase domain-containing protein [Campylobacterales bacterium]|nr:phosphoethanolamine transferase domain-containing protein [Campylobacterales bacterium]
MNYFKNFFTKKIQVPYGKFIVYFGTIHYIIHNLINYDKLTKWFYIGGTEFDLVGFVAYLVLGLALFLFVYALIAHRYTTKPVTIFLIIASSASTYFIAKYNVAVDNTMLLNMVYTDTTEVGSLLSRHMIIYCVFLILIPLILLYKIEIIFDRPLRHTLTSLGIATIAFVISFVSLYSTFNNIHRAGNASDRYILYSLVPDNYLGAILDIAEEKIAPLYQGETVVEYEAKTTKEEDLIVVLAIGESLRQKNMNLYGYTRVETTPKLNKQKDLYALNGIALVGSTILALPKILEKEEIKLVNLTRKAKVKSNCFVHFTLYNNCPGEIDTKDTCTKEDCFDGDVIPPMKKHLDNYKGGYELVVLHMGGGSHGPIYSDRHPKSYQKYKPMCFDADVLNKCTQEELYNSYDNSILYTDDILNETIEYLDNLGKPYVFIFTSDHGESLGEEGRIFHGMPPGMSLPKEQAQVPLLVKSSIPLKIIKREKYPQPDIYDTILDLFSIESTLHDKKGSFLKKP